MERREQQSSQQILIPEIVVPPQAEQNGEGNPLANAIFLRSLKEELSDIPPEPKKWEFPVFTIIELDPEKPWPYRPTDYYKIDAYLRCPECFVDKKNRKRNNSHAKKKTKPSVEGELGSVQLGITSCESASERPFGSSDAKTIGTSLHEFVSFMHDGELLQELGIDERRILSDETYTSEAIGKWKDYLNSQNGKSKHLVRELEKVQSNKDRFEKQILRPIQRYITTHRESGSEVIASEGKYAYRLVGKKSYKIGAERKTKELPVAGKFDQVRYKDNGVEIWEFKKDVHELDYHHALQLGMHLIGFQSYWRTAYDEDEQQVFQPDELTGSMHMPDLILYNLSTAERNKLQIANMGSFITSLRNIMFFSHILMKKEFSVKNPEHKNHIYAEQFDWLEAQQKDMIVTIGNTSISLPDAYAMLRRETIRFQETYTWETLSEAQDTLEDVKPIEETSPSQEQVVFPRFSFFIPTGWNGRQERIRTPSREREFIWRAYASYKRDGKEIEFDGPGIPEVVRNHILTRRGVSPSEREQFLNPPLSEVTAESVGIDEQELLLAKDTISTIVENNGLIGIFGDYDADGICSTGILEEALQKLITKKGRGEVISLIPKRDEGYGLSRGAVDEFFTKAAGRDLLILTVDNGISAHDAIDYVNAKEVVSRDDGRIQDIRTIVIDHHALPKEQVNADAIIHTTDTSASGIAYIVAETLAPATTEHERKKRVEKAAIGVIADMVPMTGATRILAKHGLESMKNPALVGLQQLGDTAYLRPGDVRRDEYDLFKFYNEEVKFKIIPRLNAVGRVADPRLAYELMMTRDPFRAEYLAKRLEDAYATQRLLVDDAVTAVNSALRRNGNNDSLVFAATDSQTHGILGLVANRIRAEHNLPTLLFSRSGGQYVGTTRSVRGFDLNNVITEHASLVDHAGGHPEAGAVSVSAGNLYKLREALSESAEKLLTREMLQPYLSYECELSLRQLTEKMYRKIEELGPFGRGNERPAFLTRATKMEIVRVFGDKNQHAELTFQKKGSRAVRAVAFNMAERVLSLKEADGIDVIYSLALDPEDSTVAQIEVKSVRGGEKAETRYRPRVQKSARDYGYAGTVV